MDKWCFGRRACQFMGVMIAIKVLVAIVVLYVGKDYVLASLVQNAQGGDRHIRSAECPTSVKGTSEDGRYYSDMLQRNLPGVNQTTNFIFSSKKPRIMCMLFTTPDKYLTQARAVNDTWGRRCDIVRWFITSGATEFPPDVVPIPIPDGRKKLTEKSNFAMRYAFTNFLNEMDWFLKADDDTYIIMENLLGILSLYDPDKPHYIGGRSGDNLPRGYNSGGAGYTLSRESLRLIVQEGHQFPTQCRSYGGFEDLETGRCLAAFSVYPIETKDINFRLTFHPDHPYKIFHNDGNARDVYTYRKEGTNYPKGIRTMSPFTVSFHSVPASFMYMYDFMLYDLQRRHDFI